MSCRLEAGESPFLPWVPGEGPWQRQPWISLARQAPGRQGPAPLIAVIVSNTQGSARCPASHEEQRAPGDLLVAAAGVSVARVEVVIKTLFLHAHPGARARVRKQHGLLLW